MVNPSILDHLAACNYDWGCDIPNILGPVLPGYEPGLWSYTPPPGGHGCAAEGVEGKGSEVLLEVLSN